MAEGAEPVEATGVRCAAGAGPFDRLRDLVARLGDLGREVAEPVEATGVRDLGGARGSHGRGDGRRLDSGTL